MNRPRRFDRNLVVIGAGTAGLVCAVVARSLGAEVTLVEAQAMGGDCLNTGCVPSKALIHAAQLAARAREAAEIGLLPAPGGIDSAAAFRHVRAAIEAVAPHNSAERFRAMGVDVRFGRARIVSPWLVAVDGIELSARSIVIATGAAPIVPSLPGLQESLYLTSETLWSLERAPGRLAVLGGGPIGCELAQAFARLGSEVTLVQQGPTLLAREDDDVAAAVAEALTRDGVRVLTGHSAMAVEEGDLVVAHGDERVRVGFDALLVAAGRRARTEGLGLEALGIEVRADGTIETDRFLRTARPSILACGDVAGPWQYTHAAAHQGWHAAVNALFAGLHRVKLDTSFMPAVTFTEPEVARVGLTEREARARGIAHEVTRHPLAELDRAIVDRARAGFVKVLTPPGRDRILGAAIVAPRAGEMLAQIALAMRQGIGLKALFGLIHAYPTYAEANRDAAGDWRKAHLPRFLVPALARYHGWRRG